MSFALLRAGAAVAALTVALPVGAWAQGGLPSDRASAQRTAQSGYDRTAQKIGSDIANAKYAIRACNYIAYERAQTAYRNDTHQLEPISKSSEEDNEAGELDKAEEVLSVVLPADEDATLPLYPGEEALDEPASHVTV